MSTFVGERGYTVYANGEIKPGANLAKTAESNKVAPEQFKSVFGDDSDLKDGHFYVPDSGLAGLFTTAGGQLTASADFVWNRAGIRTSPYVVWLCALGLVLDLLSGVIVLAQGEMTPGDAVVIVITLVTFICLMFVPRLMIEVTGRVFHKERGEAIAKLSALVQHEAERS